MYNVKYLSIIVLSLSLFTCDNNPSGPVENTAVKVTMDSVYGCYVPGQTTLSQYNKDNGALVSDTTFSMYDFLYRWGSLKYLKITSDSAFTYCVSDGCLYVAHTSVQRSHDTLFLLSRFNDATRAATKEYITCVDSGFQIESRYDTNDLASIAIVYKTQLRKFSQSLPLTSWDSISCRRDF